MFDNPGHEHPIQPATAPADKTKALERLMELALRLGASGAKIIPAEDVIVDDRLAALCRESKCGNYGRSVNCPPHVSGPAGFRQRIETAATVLFFKIDVPTQTLLSFESLMDGEGRTAFQWLHETAAAIEASAVEMGYANARAFAGGSCKNIFCYTLYECPALLPNGKCRHPDVARPSMSGFGIDVGRLFQRCGWEMQWVTGGKKTTSTAMTNICGLVIID